MIKTVRVETYSDKVYGGWFGKCLGGASGAKLEGFKTYNNVNDLSFYIDKNIPNDDLDIQLLWLDIIEKYGLEKLSPDIMAKMWQEKCWYPFSEYGYFLRNYARGILPPQSGRFNNNYFKDGMGAAIRSEIWAFTNVGRINNTIHFAKMDASLDHYGDGVASEVLLAVLENYAFFESDIIKLYEFALNYIDKDCKLYRCIKLVMNCYQNGFAIEKTRQQVLRQFGHPDFTNCVQNLAFIAMGLLYGDKDIQKSINIALTLGYDTDCTAATIGAVLGIIIGYENISCKMKELINDYFVCGIDAKGRNNSVLQLSKDTCAATMRYFKNGEISLDINDKVVELEGLLLTVEYLNAPGLVPDSTCEVGLCIANNTDDIWSGKLAIDYDKNIYAISYPSYAVSLAKGEKCDYRVQIKLIDIISEIPNINKFVARLVSDDNHEEVAQEFGLAGAMKWTMKGVYYDALKKEHNATHPPCHGEGCFLPSLECMVNNFVEIEKSYVDENDFNMVFNEPDESVFAIEDLIPIEKIITIKGQVALYLRSEIYYPKDEEVWVVIGNSDAYKLWINDEFIDSKDEMRCWTPYNNCSIIKLKKGRNSFVLKLLKRTDLLKFSFGLRKYEGQYWHRKQWITDFSSVL